MNKIVAWDNYDQICLNAPVHDAANHQAGQGDLYYDWDRSEQVWNEEEGTYNWIVPPRENPMSEEDFVVTTECFRNTVFDTLLHDLTSAYSVGRVRIMKLAPKTCLTWHKDNTKRIHYPLKTHEGCLMIIGDEVRHMPENTWWLTDTLHDHTAINASTEPRLHIVACVL